MIAIAMVLGSIFLFRAAAYSSAFFTQFGLIFAGMLAGVGGIYMNGGFGVASIVIIAVIAFFIHTTIEAIREAVARARDSLGEARTAFNTLQAEVDRLELMLSSLGDWMEQYEACVTCDRPPIPVQVVSAEAEAALAGFFGRSSVDLRVGYRVFGERRFFQAGFGGSMSELAQAIFQAVSDDLF